MREMRIDQNESINLNLGTAADNSYISNGHQSYINRSAKNKFIKTKSRIDSNISYFSGKNTKTQPTDQKRKLGWGDYFKSQMTN